MEEIDLTLIQEIERVIDLQKQILEIYISGVHNVCEIILSTRFVQTKENIISLAENIVTISKYRPANINLVVELLVEMMQSRPSHPALTYLPNEILNRIFLFLTQREVLYSENALFYLMRKMMLSEIVSKNEILRRIRYFREIHPNLLETSLLLFAWFARELEDLDINLYDSLDQLLREHMSDQALPLCIRKFYNQIPDLLENNWQLWEQYTSRTHFSDPILECIRFDSDEQLKLYLSPNSSSDKKENSNKNSTPNDPNETNDHNDHHDTNDHHELHGKINVNSRIESTIFEIHFLMHSNPTLLQCAAYFSSNKCFRLLSDMGAIWDCSDSKNRNLECYAVAGWNYSLITEIDEKCGSEGALRVSAEFFIPRFFTWMKESEQVSQEQIILGLYDCFFTAALVNNLYVINFFLDNKVDLSTTSDDGSSVLHFAVVGRHPTCLKCLLAQPSSNPNIINKNLRAPIHLAINFDPPDYQCLDLLIKDKRTDLNIRTINKMTPLMMAAEMGNARVVGMLLRDPLNRVDVNAQDCDGMTALHFAITADSSAIVVALLDHPGINIDLMNSKGVTPSMESLKKPNPLIIKAFQRTLVARNAKNQMMRKTIQEKVNEKDDNNQPKKIDEDSKKEDEDVKKIDEDSKKEDEDVKKEDEDSKKEDEDSKKEDEDSKKEDDDNKKDSDNIRENVDN